VHEGAGEREGVDSRMCEEPPVLARERRGDETRRKLVCGEPSGPAAAAGGPLGQEPSVAVDDLEGCVTGEVEEYGRQGAAADPKGGAGSKDRDGENRGKERPEPDPARSPRPRSVHFETSTSTSDDAVRPNTSGVYISSARVGAV